MSLKATGVSRWERRISLTGTCERSKLKAWLQRAEQGANGDQTLRSRSSLARPQLRVLLDGESGRADGWGPRTGESVDDAAEPGFCPGICGTGSRWGGGGWDGGAGPVDTQHKLFVQLHAGKRQIAERHNSPESGLETVGAGKQIRVLILRRPTQR